VSRFVRSFPAPEEPPVRVVICDDMPELRELLRYFVEREAGTVLVGEASDGWEAVRLAAETAPEVIVLDLGMPGPEPDELVPSLCNAAPDAALVLYSGTPASVLGSHRRALAIEITKGEAPAAVVERIRELGRARRRRAGRSPRTTMSAEEEEPDPAQPGRWSPRAASRTSRSAIPGSWRAAETS